MNYNEMSDFEINKRVAKSLWPDCSIQRISERSDWVMAYNLEGDNLNILNHGFGPADCIVDAWPIIVENRISLFPTKYTEQGWQAEHAIHGVAKDKNPLRAAMIVYLMIQEEE